MKVMTGCASLPAVQTWLGHELETRGIDAVVYTRYILSILQQDGFEPEGGDPFEAGDPHFRLRTRQQGGRVNGKKRKRNKGQQRLRASTEDRKKTAVLECLQSVTEEECGIEGLVEELCLKLKKVQEERDDSGNEDVSLRIEETESKGSEGNGSTNPAERYYAAFPALDGNSSGNTEQPAKGRKPKGVWSSITGSSVLLPATNGTPESRSACVSRSSNSPTSFEKRKQTRSLPNSLTPSRQNSFNSGQRKSHRPKDKEGGGNANHRDHVGRYRHYREPFIRYPRPTRGSGRKGYDRRGFQHKRRCIQPVKNIQKYPPLIPLKVVFARPPSQAVAPPVIKHAGQPSPEMMPPEFQQSLWEERHPLKDSENGDFFLEQAVHSMAESICRGIVDDFDGEILAGETVVETEDSHLLDRLVYGYDEWSQSHPSECFDDPRFASVSVVCEDAEALAPVGTPGTGAKRESDFAPGSPALPEKGPWLESARSCQQATPNLLSPSQPELNTSEDHSANTSVSEELSVVIDDEPLVQEMSSPRSAPIGTGRGNDSLLRICHHDHSSARSKQQEGMQVSTKDTETEWPPVNSKSQEKHGTTSDPPSENIWGGFVAEQSQSSLAEGIMSSYAPTDPTSNTSMTSDLNSALWSTYDSAPPLRMQPPKVVTWGETVLSPLVSHLKTATPFIEGGVYGSPYGSQNNSHYNSCSTSPGAAADEAGMGLRDLWGSAEHLEELSAAASKLEEYFSPRHTPCQTIDEQSIIEDSLADSPKFLSSRSSSRFEFAQPPSPQNSDRSSPTETDDMVSETEVFEETVRRKDRFLLDMPPGFDDGFSTCNNEKDGGGSNAFISMQDSCRLDANSNINPNSPSASGHGDEEEIAAEGDVDDLRWGLEKAAITVVSGRDTSGLDPLLQTSGNRYYFTPVEKQSEGPSKGAAGLSAGQSLQLDLPHRRDDGSGGSLSRESVQSKKVKESASSGRGRWDTDGEEMTNRVGGYQGSCSFAVGGGVKGGTLATTAFQVGPGMGYFPDSGMGHLPDFSVDVKQGFNDQFFPFEEEVFLEEEGIIAPGGLSVGYCDSCNNQKSDCEECRSSRSSRFSRGSSLDDQEIDGNRQSGSTKVERGSYSSRPPETIPGKPQPSKPIKITSSR